MISAAAWRPLLKFWLPALVLCVVNLAILSTYRFLLAGQSQLRAARVARLEAESEALERRRSALADLVTRAQANRARIDHFYGSRLATEAERLTRVIAEVKTLAGRAGVQTSSFGYPEEILEDYGLVKRSVVFTARGGYRSLRQFVNFVELSDEFLMLEDMRLSEQGQQGSEVRVDLRISTLFRSGPSEAEETGTPASGETA